MAEARRTFESPLGPLTATVRDGRIVRLAFVDEGARDRDPVLEAAARQLAAYFARRLRRFDLPLAPAGTAFQRRVWAEMARIPYGETRTYGELARRVRSAPRAVGRACGANPIPILLPCHRVLAAAGGLGGYSGGEGPATKRRLLALENPASGAPPGRARRRARSPDPLPRS